MIITQTPLRISFVGGGTDLRDFYRNYGGAVISSAIDKYVYVIVKERFDELIYLNWTQKEIVDNVDEIKHELIREAMRKTEVLKGVEITTLSDIPAEGSGLGSSSSITVGLLQALYLYNGMTVDAEKLAQDACEIEIDILGKPIGKQDQYIAAYGGMRHFSFHQNENVSISNPNMDSELIKQLSFRLMLFYTGQTRKSADILTEQKQNIDDTVPILQRMKDQTYEVLVSFTKGDIDFLGEALDLGWKFKKKLAGGISNPDIEMMYKKAQKAGAIGGKIAGAGGGGFMLLYVPLENQQKVRETLREYRELHFGLERDGSKVIFNIRR